MKFPTILLFTLSIFGCSVFAQHSHSHGEDKDHHSHSHGEDKHHHDKHDHGHSHASGHHATIMVPEDPAEVWAHINAYSKVVKEAAKSGDIDTLHKEQLNLEALVGELAHSLSTFEKEGRQKRVEGMINNAKRALSQLHTATDAKDQSSINKHVKSLSGVLILLKAQYPKEVTSGMAEVKDDIGPHEGMLAEFKDSSGKPVGFIELKLHDDKGDLELWIATDSGITNAYDIDAKSTVTVKFTDAKKDTATLAVRNMGNNEDEAGVATMRNGKTNYFIYPGASGESADWLQGKQFKSMVTVAFKGYSTDSFLLIPHGHHGHSHEH